MKNIGAHKEKNNFELYYENRIMKPINTLRNILLCQIQVINLNELSSPIEPKKEENIQYQLEGNVKLRL